MRQDYICESHGKALKCLEEINRIITNMLKNYDLEEDVADDLGNIEYEVSSAVDCIKEAKESGEKMESRLYKYKEAIECLGFERVKI